MAVSPSQQTPAKSRLPSSFRPLKEQPSEELNLSTDELLFLPLTELELFCESFESDFTDEEDFSLPELFCEPEDRSSSLEAGTTEDEESSAGSGAGAELLDSSPHAASRARRMDRATALFKIFTKPPVTSNVFAKFS